MMERSRSRLIFASLLFLGLATTVLVIYDNTDHATRSLRAGETELWMVSAKYNKIIKDMEVKSQEKVAARDQHILKKASGKKNACLKDPSKAGGDTKEQLESFVEGDCAPIILLPGLLSAKLQVKIDCPTLMESHPEIMAACGWSTCSWSLFYSRPASEYTIWIPGFFTAMTFLTFTNTTCFGSLYHLEYNQSKTDIYEKYQDPKGLNVTWYGDTPDTEQYADGGFGSVSNLLPLPFQMLATSAFAGMDAYYTEMGYQKGLNLFALPYDCRRTHLANIMSFVLERTIRYAYNLTGKKVVIAAHSLGNLNTLPVLSKMSQEDKDKMIAAYVPIGAPFSGSSKAIRGVLGGDGEYIFLDGFFQLQYYNQKTIIGTTSSILDLYPRDTYYRFKDAPWMQDLMKRAALENQFDPKTPEGAEFWKKNQSDIPYPFFPGKSETCFEGFTDRPKECFVGVSDLTKEPISRILNESYYANTSSTNQMLSTYFTMNNFSTILAMNDDSVASGIDNLENPTVPVVYIYGTHLATELRHEWNYDPRVNTVASRYAFPSNTVNKYGDGTVEVSFSLPIAMKWAWENLNNQTNAKPVKIVEYCSSYNRKNSVWDTTDQSGMNIMNHTEYVGLSCDCLKNLPGEGDDCSHANMIGDSYIIEIVGNIAITMQNVTNKESTGAFKLSSDALKVLAKDLPHLRKPRGDQNVTGWLNL